MEHTQFSEKLADVKPAGWIRRWALDGEKPAKVKNEKGRWVWPQKFKLLPVTEGQCLPTDEPLVPASSIAALKAQRDELLAGLEKLCTNGIRMSSEIDADWDAARALIAKHKEASHG